MDVKRNWKKRSRRRGSSLFRSKSQQTGAGWLRRWSRKGRRRGMPPSRSLEGRLRISDLFWTGFPPVSDVTIVWWPAQSVTVKSVSSGHRSLSMMETNFWNGRIEKGVSECQQTPLSSTLFGCRTWLLLVSDVDFATALVQVGCQLPLSFEAWEIEFRRCSSIFREGMWRKRHLWQPLKKKNWRSNQEAYEKRHGMME